MMVSIVTAPAKVTWSLSVGPRRPDGYHDLEAEMLTVDLADTLEITEPGDDLSFIAAESARAEHLSLGEDNLIAKALRLVGRRASVMLDKRIPLGGGLGGGSADAGAILRWAGGVSSQQAATLGGDVPFCAIGGRAQVSGIGDIVEPLAFIERSMVLVIPPFGVDTGACYGALDTLRDKGGGHHERNDLFEAAEIVAPRLGEWRRYLESLTGRDVCLAGSGSTMFLEGTRAEMGLGGMGTLALGRDVAMVFDAVSIPASAGDPRSE
jgi:4-diphosphocytidyl-2-C-methyl-D-erythritol kinase